MMPEKFKCRGSKDICQRILGEAFDERDGREPWQIADVSALRPVGLLS